MAVVVLAAASAVYNLNREAGPPAAFEALHSGDGAVETCRTGLEGELGMGSEPAGPFTAEYLGGGEYEVRGPVTVHEGGLPVRASVLCEVQFVEAGGWRMLDAALDG